MTITEIVALPDGRLAGYHVAGQGIPALMFPGFTAASMREHSALFPSVLRSYLIDLPGPARQLAVRQAGFYELARSSLGLGRVIVFGHSAGSAAALAYAATYPQHTAACVLVSPGAAAGPLPRRISCRTLVIGGEFAPIGGEIPGAEFVALAATESPDGYRQVVLDFLRGSRC